MLKRIKFFLPQAYKNDPLAQAILQSVEKYTDEIKAYIREKFDQMSATTSGESGIGEWEKELAITPKNADLDVRRAIVRARLMRPPTMTPERLTAIANQFTYQQMAKVVHQKRTYILEVHVPIDDVISSREMYDEVYLAKPAHLDLYILYEIMLPVNIELDAAITALVDSCCCFWNRGTASFVRRDGKYKRNRSVRRNRLDPDSLYRTRQNLIAEMEQRIDSGYLVAIEPKVNFLCQNESALPVRVDAHGADMQATAETCLPLPVEMEAVNMPVMDAAHWTNHRTANLRNRTHARDGAHKRGRRYVQDGFMNLACTCIMTKNGKTGRLESL